jgi:hypothetical protein
MSKDNGLSDEADAAIAEAVRIVKEDKMMAYLRSVAPKKEDPPPDPKPTDPPPKKEEPPEPEPKKGKGLWWSPDRLEEPPPPEPKKEPEPNA